MGEDAAEPEPDTGAGSPRRRRAPERARVEATLDSVVARNRFTIAVVFPLAGAALLLASAEGVLPDPLAFNPWLLLVGVAVMRLPLIAGLAPVLDRRAVAAIALLCGYTYAIEWVGATTGVPYGAFRYEVALGPMLFDTIPLALPLFFVPLVLNAVLLWVLLAGGWGWQPRHRVPAVVATVLAIDLVLDPAAVALGFWTFAEGGYYGVPASNYAGWLLSATVATLLVESSFRTGDLRERLETCPYMLDDMVSFVLLWGAVNAYYGAWIPVGIAVGFAVTLLHLDRFDFDVRPRWLTAG